MTVVTVIMSMISVGVIFLGVIEITDHYVKAREHLKEVNRNQRSITMDSLIINKR